MHCIYIAYAFAPRIIGPAPERNTEMTLHSARTFVVRDRLDWNKPHLQWMPNRLYRLFRRARTRA